MFAIAAVLGDSGKPAPKVVAPKVEPFTFTGDAGYVSTSGNTSVKTLNLGDKVLARFDALLFTQQFAVVQARSDGKAVTSSWRNQFRSDLGVHAGTGVYASVTYERDTFAGLASRVGTVTGVTAQVIKTRTDKLVVEGGVSLTNQRGTADNSVDQDFLGGRAATAYVHQLGPRAAVSQSIELLPDFRDSADLRINTETDLLAPFTRRAAVKLSYVVHFDGVPEPGYESTDRLFTSGVQVTL
jgi:putative salt-induced outer membrane protein YdiY